MRTRCKKNERDRMFSRFSQVFVLLPRLDLEILGWESGVYVTFHSVGFQQRKNNANVTPKNNNSRKYNPGFSARAHFVFSYCIKLPMDASSVWWSLSHTQRIDYSMNNLKIHMGVPSSPRGRCELSQRSTGTSPSRNWFGCILASKSDVWWQQY